MYTINGMATTYNCPNYAGELVGVSPEDTPLLSATGGLYGLKVVHSTVFGWQGYDLRDAASDRQRLEGADAPEAEARARYQALNVTEIHQEAIEVSYSKMGAYAQFGTMPDAVPGNGAAIPQNELDWQIEQGLKQIARDIELSFIVGTYANPADGSAPDGSARKTRGLVEAITTNVVTAEAITAEAINDLAEQVWTSGGLREGETRTLIVGAKAKRALSKAFITDVNYREQTRNVGGVNLQTIETDFGKFNVMLNRYMPDDMVLAVSLEQVRPVVLEVPGKGTVFAEPLAKTGSAEKVQLYAEVGLEYGNEKAHGKLIIGGADE